MTMAIRILCVCLGNICRSPTGQAVLETVMPGAEVDSAGTGGWHVGDPPYAPMQAAARARGHDLSGQRARQVRPEDFHRFDLILAMDSQNLADLRAMRPDGAPAHLALYLDVLEDGPRDVPDPYYTRDFDGVVRLIERAAAAWAERLAP
jgi:protein-tyrosine phosphatase